MFFCVAIKPTIHFRRSLVMEGSLTSSVKKQLSLVLCKSTVNDLPICPSKVLVDGTVESSLT